MTDLIKATFLFFIYANHGRIRTTLAQHNISRKTFPAAFGQSPLCGQNKVLRDIAERRLLVPRRLNPDGVIRVAVGGLDGSVKDRTMFPWMVSMGYEEDGKWIHLCGGSLVTSNHVLTAAHCLEIER